MDRSITPRGERHVVQGWGACGNSAGCECREFQGSGDLCGNCGHQFGDHS